MPGKKFLGAMAMGAALAGGGVAGVVLGVPATSGAQTAEESPTTTVAPSTSSGSTDDATTDAPGRPGRKGWFGGGVDLSVAADALGLSEDDLRTKLRDGQTLAEIATEQGVDQQAVVDALVAAATEAIDDAAAEAKAALPERIEDLVEGGWRGGPGFGFAGGRGAIRSFVAADAEAAADALGLSREDLRTKLRDGQTLADVATEQGVDVQVVIDAMVAAATAELDQAVTDGDLTQTQADERRADLVERTTDLVHGELPARPGGFGPGGFGPGGHHRGPGSSSDGVEAEGSSVTTS